MGPDFGIGMGREGARGASRRPRPTLVVRGMELAGLALVTYGLGSYRFAFAAVGAVLIVGSYSLYRRKNGPTTLGFGASMDSRGPDADGGGE